MLYIHFIDSFHNRPTSVLLDMLDDRPKMWSRKLLDVFIHATLMCCIPPGGNQYYCYLPPGVRYFSIAFLRISKKILTPLTFLNWRT